MEGLQRLFEGSKLQDATSSWRLWIPAIWRNFGILNSGKIFQKHVYIIHIELKSLINTSYK